MGCDDRDRAPDPDLSAGPDLGAVLARWLAEARVSEAAGARERQRWLGRQLSEETTLTDVLLELAERGRPVVVRTVLGERHRATVMAVGTDMVGLDVAGRGHVYLRTDAVSSLRTRPREDAALPGRRPPVTATFFEMLGALEAEGERVGLTTSEGERAAGRLVALNRDLVTLRLEGDRANLLYVPVDRVIEVAPAAP